MEKRSLKRISLFQMFLRQMIWLAFSVLLELLIAVLLFSMAIRFDVVLPANYAQNYIILHEKQIAASTDLDQMLPYMCYYGLYDENKIYQNGNFPEELKDKADKVLRNNDNSAPFYSVIKRADGYSVIKYDLKVHFSNKEMDRLFPNIELLFWILIVLVFLLLIVTNAYAFGKKLKKQLTPLLGIIQQIKNQELDFEEENSKIKEINEISQALYEMKTALSDSLKNEWSLQQQKKNNIRALAHDIKTPLTVIKGNAQLILEEENLMLISQSAVFVNQSADQIEEYVQQLMDEMQSEEILSHKQELDMEELISQLNDKTELLCTSRDTTYRFDRSQITADFIIRHRVLVHRQRVIRAVLNITDNAIEYGGIENDGVKNDGVKNDGVKYDDVQHKAAQVERPAIDMTVYHQDGMLCIEIADHGKGFSKEALLHAKEQFYTSHKERQSAHYGMGLFFAAEVAKEHQGTLDIQNKEDGGGQVTISLACLRA